jgi:hypothetical protein
MAVTMPPAVHLFERRHTTLQRFAADVLELDGRVADLKLLAEQLIEFDQNARAC